MRRNLDDMAIVINNLYGRFDFLYIFEAGKASSALAIIGIP